ncbi:hypothetical protein BUALT_Bualt13G0101300 [Buddleja alternifolia]|uniref:hAT-like transposase RNase-H fold domain-containing protein n=1 Tax=Buddleja alternifolia TaxID=168488 RepID=A0AAV6WTX2_9LAMI|nr:hypothetical protein BUALT_Bualt13G0101300 [Buddleja alternifolia]
MTPASPTSNGIRRRSQRRHNTLKIRPFAATNRRFEMSTSYSESSQARDSGVNEEIIIETGKTKRKASAKISWNGIWIKRFFSVVVDNASSNDSMMRKLREWLLKDSLIPLNGDLLHVRCSAHVLNLIVQDGLSPIRGLIEKIRETVRYLNKSPSATQKFDTALRHCNLEGKRKVAMDVPNRWNSTYLLLETALPLKEAFCRLQRIDGHYQFSPSESEWEVAKIVHDCLKYFYEATHHFSGSKYPTFNVFFPDISVAVVFDPRLKMKMVEFFYKKLYGSYADSYIERVRDTLLELFIAYGGSCATQSTIPSSINLETSTSLSEFYMWCNESNASVIPKSGLDSYLEEASNGVSSKSSADED